jgi:polyisoprenoid-binding protein YceI
MKKYTRIALFSAGILLAGLFSFKMLNAEWNVNKTAAVITWNMPNGKHSGTISELDATITFDPSQSDKGVIKATVKASSIDAGNPKLNDHLKTADFFDAANHPDITFLGESIEKNDSGFVATGKLTIRDSTHTVKVPFKFIKGEKESSTIKGTMDIFAGDYGLMKKSSEGNDRVVISIEVPMTKK